MPMPAEGRLHIIPSAVLHTPAYYEPPPDLLRCFPVETVEELEAICSPFPACLFRFILR